MVEATIRWTDNERFVGEATSRHAVVMDAAKEKTANSPLELVLIALCGCTATDVVTILRKKREPFTTLEVRAEADRATTPPMVFTRNSTDLHGWWQGRTQSRRRCSALVRREILLRRRHAR